MDFIDIKQHVRLREHAKKLDSAKRAADGTAGRVEDLTETVERLKLACKAMWELVREHTPLTDEDLMARVREIDLRDGRLDGRAGGAPRACPDCERPNGGGRSACLYCGAALPEAGPL